MKSPQKVLVTGSSSGFGKLTAKALLSRGHTVFATMREPGRKNKENALELSVAGEESEGQVHILALDVTSDEEVDAAVGEALAREGAIDAVVNNAGYGTGHFVETYTVEQLRDLFEANVFGVQRLNRAVLPHMRARRSGLLVHVSSTFGRVAYPYSGPYVASKYALEGLAEAYRYELAPFGVDSVIVEPGAFATNFGLGIVAPGDEARLRSYGEEQDRPGQFWGALVDVLQGDGAPDPHAVSSAIVELVEKPVGTRPLRTVVDTISGPEVERINQVSSSVQESLFREAHLTHLLGPAAQGT